MTCTCNGGLIVRFSHFVQCGVISVCGGGRFTNTIAFLIGDSSGVRTARSMGQIWSSLMFKISDLSSRLSVDVSLWVSLQRMKVHCCLVNCRNFIHYVRWRVSPLGRPDCYFRR